MKKSIVTCISLIALSASITAYAAEETQAQPAVEKTSPQLVEGSMPVYPEIARELAIEGIVRIEFLVDERGNVFGAGVIQSVNPDLDDAALAAVKNWKFEPATLNGKAVPQVVQVPIRFRLIEKEGRRDVSVTSGVEIASRS